MVHDIPHIRRSPIGNRLTRIPSPNGGNKTGKATDRFHSIDIFRFVESVVHTAVAMYLLRANRRDRQRTPIIW